MNERTNALSHLLGIWRLVRGYRLRYVAANLSLGLAACAQTGIYLGLRAFVDRVLVQRLSVPLAAAALGFVILAAVQGTFTALSGRLAAATSEGTTRRLRDSLFDRLQHLSFAYHDRTPTGDLVERATSDVDAVRRFYAEQAIGIGRIALLFAVNFAALTLFAWKLALISIAVIPPVLGVSILFFRRLSKRYEEYQEQEAVLTTTLQENLTGIRVVKAFARQDYEMERFERVNREKFLRGRRLMMMHSLFWPITDLLCGFQMLAGMIVAALMAIAGTVSVGSYVAYTGILIQLIWPIRFLGRLIVDTSSGLVSYGRVQAVLTEATEAGSEREERAGTAKELRGKVEFENVSFGYEASAPVLRNVSFACRPGEVVALLGTTGSGKTSLVNLLPRFYDHASGRILLDGRELREYPREELRRRIGIVEQEPFLFSRTLRENIAYGVDREVSPEEIEAAAKAAAIHQVILSFPHGYDTLIGEKGVTLSGGQKQRVAIARTLLRDPRILIFDDATSSVDAETEAQIQQALERLMAGRTTFLIAHRIQSLMRADLILVFEAGEIVERGDHESLMRRNGMYRRIYELQTRLEAELEREASGG